MAVYFVVQNTITNAEKMQTYLDQLFGTIPQEGVRLLAMDDGAATLEGEAPPISAS